MNLLRSFLRASFIVRMLAVVVALAPATTQAATFTGEFWKNDSQFRNINQALNFIASESPTATFQSTAIDYPNGSTNTTSSNTTLANFLGADAASIIGDGLVNIQTSVFRFTGFVDLLPGNQQFITGSDDGYRLTVNGVRISQQSRPRSFNSTTRNRDPGEGRATFELLFFENYGNSGLEVFIDGAIVLAAPIPLPAGFTLILSALAALGLLKWRNRRTLPLVNHT
jgi:hypothetical protein